MEFLILAAVGYLLGFIYGLWKVRRDLPWYMRLFIALTWPINIWDEL